MHLHCDFFIPTSVWSKGDIMQIEVREILALAAYNGITRKAIVERAGIAPTSFTNWKTKSPNLKTLNKARNALDDLIALKALAREKVEG
jgi:hypothetical protein